MFYFVYVIRSSSTDKMYTGISNDIDRRVSEHNKKLANTRITKNLTDFNLIFLTLVENRKIAREIEIYLKSGSGREFRNSLL